MSTRINRLASLVQLCLAVFLLALTTAPVHAQYKFPTDVKGGADHPLIKRFTGSSLIGYRTIDWEQSQMPTGVKVDGRSMKEFVTVEGKITRLIYLAPTGKARLEVFRNYQQALESAGFKKIFTCEKEKGCSDLFFAWSNDGPFKALDFSEGGIPRPDGKGAQSINRGVVAEGRFLYGTLNQGGRDLHILVYSSVAENDVTDTTATYIEIVEPKAMQTGQVSIDSKAMQAGLLASGKIALYGIFFDTGKAEVKGESKAQLDEMAKLLQGQPNLKVYIVGHTDNQGQLDANIALSQQRAQSVVAVLTAAPYKVDPKRLVAKGVANLAPVASNDADSGRSKNRRVELVVQ